MALSSVYAVAELPGAPLKALTVLQHVLGTVGLASRKVGDATAAQGLAEASLQRGPSRSGWCIHESWHAPALPWLSPPAHLLRTASDTGASPSGTLNNGSSVATSCDSGPRCPDT